MKTYGTARLSDGYWLLDVQPHVAIRIKRAFGKLDKHSHGTLRLKATDEVSRDLLWFTQRFPLKVKPRAELEQRAKRYDDMMADFDRLLAGAVQPQHFELALPAREYQRVAAQMMLTVRRLLVADDVGLGKTCMVIAALSDPSTRPALVVTLPHLAKQWQDEIKKFSPKLRTHIVRKGTPYDVRLGARRAAKSGHHPELFELEFPDVLIITYHKLAGWADALKGVAKSVAFDECQELRRPESHKAGAAAVIASMAQYCWGTSATPIFNYGIEFWHVLSVLRPDALGELGEFTREWCTGGRVNDPKAFGLYLREHGLMLRRTRKEVARELPPLTRIIQHCDTDEAALKQVESAAAELARIILSRETAWHERGEATRELDWRLRQATGIAKAPYVAALVRMLVESGEKVVLYGWHRAVYDLWLDLLADVRPVLYTGSESPAAKEKSKKDFVYGDASVFVISLRAGQGLDGLQHACHTVVYGELDWSWSVHEQGEGRVARDGQTDPVTVYYPLSAGGSDPIVSETIGIKREQLEGVRDPNAELVQKLESDTSEGLRRLAQQYLARAASTVPTAEARA